MKRNGKWGMYLLTIAITAGIITSGCSLTKDKNKPKNTIEMFSTRALITKAAAEKTTADDNSVTSEKTKVSFKKGTLTDTSYENEFFNIKFTLPENFFMPTLEEMKEQIKTANNALGIRSTASSAIEMGVYSNSGGTNLQVMAEKVFRSMSEDSYLNTSQSNMSTLGVDISAGDITTEKIAGQKFRHLRLTLSMGYQQVQEDLYVRKKDNYMLTLILVHVSDDSNEGNTLLKSFTKLK